MRSQVARPVHRRGTGANAVNGPEARLGLTAQCQLHPCIPARIAIPSPFSNFQRLLLQCERFGVIHVVTAVITAKGACIMTTSTTENREPAQATATAAGKPKPPQKANVAAKKGRAAASQATSARKPRSAKQGAQPRRKAGNARPASKTANILSLGKRPSGATLK